MNIVRLASRSIFTAALVASAISVSAFTAQSCYALDESTATASQSVKESVDRVMEIVEARTPSTSEAELDRRLTDVISPLFDFEEMAKRCLGTNWPKAKPEEQKEFVALFRDLLARTYLKRIKEQSAESTITIVGERAEGQKALVKTSVITARGDKVSLDYRLMRTTRWRVFDVVIENVGLVSNYRQEFSEIVRNGGMKALLEKLHAKK